jgi:hypothetical protein
MAQMRSMRTLLCVVIALVPALACDGSGRPTDPRGVALLVRGKWSEQVQIPGVALVLNLDAHDTVVTGTGSYAIEAGRSGVLTVSGLVDGSQIRLDLVYDSGTEAHFVGELSELDRMAGSIKYGPPESEVPSFPITFARTN